MKIIVAGGTGFIGNALVPKLIADGHQVVLLRRPSSKSGSPLTAVVETADVDLGKPILSENLQGDAIINLVGIIREYPHKGITFVKSHYLVTKNLVDFAVRNRIGQFLQMSALGAKPDAKTGYEQTKYAAECRILESGLNWTIFRPSIIIGPESRLILLLNNMIVRLPAIPVIGDGQQKIQPLNIDDVCDGFRLALGNERSRGSIFEFGGPEIITFDRMLDILGETLNHHRLHKWHQPIWMLRLLAALMGRFRWFPLTNDQITMLLENSYTDDRSYFEHFGIQPKSPWTSLQKSYC
jgi:nucleoside-diphosphate-sugar epimerase